MKHRNRILAIRLLLMVCAVLAIAACNEDSDTAVSQVTSPPDFNYADGEELRSHMEELGFQLALMDRGLIEDEFNQIDQQEVVSILREMELIGSSFRAEDAGESHSFLQEDMSAFINTVIQARIAASMSPPGYYLAGKVAGGCVNCHKVN